MPEKNDPAKKQGEQHPFIREKIVRQPLSKKQLLRRLCLGMGAALVMGMSAAVGFAAMCPLAFRYLGGQETSEEETKISIPKDEPSEETPPAAEPEASAETEPIEEQVQSAIEHYRYSVDDLATMYASLRNVAQQADKGIVQVQVIRQEVDWFDNPVETSGIYAGAVIASTRREILILAPESAAAENASIRVTFADGASADGVLKQKDRIGGMAVISVDIDAVGEDTWNTVETLSLGNSYTLKQGDLVIAVGSPAGMVHSTNYGTISYVMKNAQVVDGVRRAIYSDISANDDAGTFLVNTAGELVGWATEELKNEHTAHMTEVLGISDYKGTLERMTNGLGVPYLGVIGQAVGEGMPDGLYVLNCVQDSPAYDAGIQNGDIITSVAGRSIVSMKDYQTAMEMLECGQEIEILVERKGRDQYTQLSFSVVVGTR